MNPSQYTISQTKSGKWVARRSLCERLSNGRLKVQALFADSESELIEKIKTVGNATHKSFQVPKTKSDWDKLICSGTTEARIAKKFRDVVCTLRESLSAEQEANETLVQELGAKSKANLDLLEEIARLATELAADRKLLRAMHIRRRVWERYGVSVSYEQVAEWQDDVLSMKLVGYLEEGARVREGFLNKQSVFFICDLIDGKEEIKTVYSRPMIYGKKGKREA
jgi:hypothetical protein